MLRCYLGPLPLGPGARLTGAPLLGLDDARATSFCRWTPFAPEPGLVFVGLISGSGSDRQQQTFIIKSDGQLLNNSQR